MKNTDKVRTEQEYSLMSLFWYLTQLYDNVAVLSYHSYIFIYRLLLNVGTQDKWMLMRTNVMSKGLFF